MRAINSQYRWNINDGNSSYEGSFAVDENGNVVNMTGAQGFDKRENALNTVSLGDSIQIANVDMEKIMKGDLSSVQGYLYDKDGNTTEQGFAIIDQIASKMGQINGSSVESQVTANINGGISATTKAIPFINASVEASGRLTASENERIDKNQSALRSLYSSLSSDDTLTNEQRIAELGGSIGGFYGDALDKGDRGVVSTVANTGIDKMFETTRDLKNLAGDIISDVPTQINNKINETALKEGERLKKMNPDSDF